MQGLAIRASHGVVAWLQRSLCDRPAVECNYGLNQDIDTEMDAQIYRLKQLWSRLRKLWANSPDTSRTEWLQTLKNRMKPNPDVQDWWCVSYKILVMTVDSI